MPSNAVPGFSLTQSAFHFNNRWDYDITYPVLTLPVVGNIGNGNAGNGLCGGFVLATLDLFLHTPRLFPPPNTDADRPVDGSALFNYLYQRLIDSWELPKATQGNVGKDIQWIQTPDPTTVGSGLRQRVIAEEWPKIKADIDAGRPSPLALVGGAPRGPVDFAGIKESLEHCHQVLAYGYEVNNANQLTLRIYDNNDPSQEKTISLNLNEPAPVSPIVAPQFDPGLRGFFRSAYTLRDPSSITGGRPAWDWHNLHKPSGVKIIGSVGAVSVKNVPDGPTRPYVFVAGSDGKLWSRQWVGASTWSWDDLGAPPGANVRGLLGTTNARDTPTDRDRPHVFVEGNDFNVWCRWWDGSAWHWHNMGKPTNVNIVGFVGAVSVTDTPTAPARPLLFVTGNDAKVWCCWSSGAAWTWTDMGRPLSASIRGLLGAVNARDTPTAPDRPHVFVEGNDFNLWCLWWSGNAWSWLNMSKPPGANIVAFAGAVSVKSTPAAAALPQLFVIGSDGHVWCRWSNGASWTWTPLGQPPGANVRKPLGAAIVQDTRTAPERAHVFVEGNDFNLWCLYWTGTSWHWLNMGKPPTVNIRAALGAAIRRDTPDALQGPYIFFEGDDFNLWARTLR